MASINSYRHRWLRAHKRYEKQAFKILVKTFRKFGKNIDFDSIDVLNYVEVVDNAVDKEELLEALKKVYLKIGLHHGGKVGADVNEQVKMFDLDSFKNVFTDFIINWLTANNSRKVESVANTYKKGITNLITKGIQNGTPIREIAKEIEKLVNKPFFYRWQAMRIARTETTAAANLAALQAGELSGFKTNKMWISSQDARTRRLPKAKYDHLEMNGKQVGFKDFFLVPSGVPGQIVEKMFYPGDPNGSPGNVINCRCTVAVVAARDRHGQPIRK